jgi:2-hydroxychromene-2-carboxylate isomerase
MVAAMKIEFWFEFASTYSYPAAMRVDDVARRHGVTVVWRPFLLGPIFQRQGWSDSPFNLYPDKGRYMWRDLERLCAGQQLPFQRPTVFPRNGLLAARIVCVADDAHWGAAFARRVYTANFAADRDIADPAVLLSCLDGLVSDPAAVIAAAADPAVKDRLRRNTERAIGRGLFGAPTFVVGDEIFWGNDRLEAALDWARAARSPADR